MGYFSWKTADSRRSIWCVDSSRTVETAYLLQPGGEPPIAEPQYEGYGVFGGVDAYEWLAKRNLTAEQLARIPADKLRDIGITMECGHYHVDSYTGAKYAIFHEAGSLLDPTITYVPIAFSEPMPGYDGRSPNELVEAGILVPHNFDVALPLKFSFRPDAVYEDLKGSEICPNQGYFAPERQSA